MALGGDLGALFADLGPGLKQDLAFYGVAAGGAVASSLVWNAAAVKLDGMLVRDGAPLLGKYQPYVIDGAAVLAGIFLGNYLIRQNNPHVRNIGRGVAVGMTAVGLTGFAKKLMPSLYAKAAAPTEQVAAAAEVGASVSGLSALPPFVMPQVRGAMPPTKVRQVAGAMPPVKARRVAGLGQMNFASALTA